VFLYGGLGLVVGLGYWEWVSRVFVEEVHGFVSTGLSGALVRCGVGGGEGCLWGYPRACCNEVVSRSCGGASGGGR